MNGKYYGQREIRWRSREKERLEHIQRKRRMANDEESNKQLQQKQPAAEALARAGTFKTATYRERKSEQK
nr:MAG TPA: hypothetical protein [Caudoviricetes sp.]